MVRLQGAGHKDLLIAVGALDLDPAMVPSYIQALLNDAHLLYVEGEVDELYTEVADVRERLNFLRIMDSEYLSYGEEDEA